MKCHCSSETNKVKMHEKSTESAGTSALSTRIETEESPWALLNTIPLFLLSLSFLLIRGHQTCPWNFASYILSGMCLPCMAVWPTMTATLWTNQVSLKFEDHFITNSSCYIFEPRPQGVRRQKVKLNCHICNLMRCMSTCPCFRMFWVPTIFDFSFNRLKAPVMFKVCLRYRHYRFDHPKPKVRLNCCPEHLRLSHVSLAAKLQERQLHG